MALTSGATFVARTIDRYSKHLAEMLRRAAEHRGTSFVEVYQNCNIFNDGAYLKLTDPERKDDNVLFLKHKKPYIFGKDSDKVLDWTGADFKVINISESMRQKKFVTHDDHAGNPAMECMLTGLSDISGMPVPIGVFRDIKMETYDDMLAEQIESIKKTKGKGDLEELLSSGKTWIVE